MRNRLEDNGSRAPCVVAHIPDVSRENVYRADAQQSDVVQLDVPQPVAVQRATELKSSGSLATIGLKIAFFALIGVVSAQLVVYFAGNLGAQPQDATQASFDVSPPADLSHRDADKSQITARPMADPAISSQLRILLEKSENSTGSHAKYERSQRFGTAHRDTSTVRR